MSDDVEMETIELSALEVFEVWLGGACDADASWEHVRRVWRRLQAAAPNLPPPQLEEADEGRVALVWSRPHVYVEVVVPRGEGAGVWDVGDRVACVWASCEDWDRVTLAPELVAGLRKVVDGA